MDIPVIECITDSSFYFNLEFRNKKKLILFNKTSCLKDINKNIRNRFNTGAVIEKYTVYLNLVKPKSIIKR